MISRFRFADPVSSGYLGWRWAGLKLFSGRSGDQKSLQVPVRPTSTSGGEQSFLRVDRRFIYWSSKRHGDSIEERTEADCSGRSRVIFVRQGGAMGTVVLGMPQPTDERREKRSEQPETRRSRKPCPGTNSDAGAPRGSRSLDILDFFFQLDFILDQLVSVVPYLPLPFFLCLCSLLLWPVPLFGSPICVSPASSVSLSLQLLTVSLALLPILSLLERRAVQRTLGLILELAEPYFLRSRVPSLHSPIACPTGAHLKACLQIYANHRAFSKPTFRDSFAFLMWGMH